MQFTRAMLRPRGYRPSFSDGTSGTGSGNGGQGAFCAEFKKGKVHGLHLIERLNFEGSVNVRLAILYLNALTREIKSFTITKTF